jgi:erythromycin esterase
MKHKVLTTLLLIFLLSEYVSAQSAICTELKKTSIKLNIEDNFEQFAFLDSTLLNNNILAIGENSHGTHEFFTTKFQIIEYCVTKLKYRTIGIESDYAGTIDANNFIREGVGTSADAVYSMGISAWMTEEMKDILEWLKQYNSDKPELHKISIYGFDMQYTKPTLTRLKIELVKLNCPSANLLDTLVTWKTNTQVDLNYLNKSAMELIEFANLQNGTLKTSLIGLINSMTTSINYLKIIDPYQRANFREKYMADNIINGYKSQSVKTLIWAHNEHITKNGNIEIWQTMGEHLSKKYGNDYYTIGLLTANGRIGFYNQNTKRGDSLEIPLDKWDSYESDFIKCGAYHFFINLRQTKETSKLQKFFSKNKEMITIDLLYDRKKNEYTVKKRIFKNNLIDKFDSIIYIETTTAARH